jgi:hypothetical protein
MDRSAHRPNGSASSAPAMIVGASGTATGVIGAGLGAPERTAWDVEAKPQTRAVTKAEQDRYFFCIILISFVTSVYASIYASS